jgi:Nif-specific regulatory protein
MLYELGQKLGEGSIGVVYAARDPATGARYAVKLIGGVSLEAGNDLIAEFDILSRLDHPNIVKGHDAGIEDDRCFLVMDLIDGFDACLAVDEVFGGDRAAYLERLAEILGALDFVHAAGAVHGDIKPTNIIFDKSGKPFLVDFGMASYTQASGAKLKGATFEYAAPEVFEGRSPDSRADLFSLGLVMYECLTQTGIERKGAQLNIDYEAVDKRFRWIVQRLTAMKPDDRFQAASDARRSLMEVLGMVRVGEPFRGETYLLNPPFVDREEELARVEEAIDSEGPESPGVILISGSTGIGKTRLVSEVKRRCISRGTAFLDFSRPGTKPTALFVAIQNHLMSLAAKEGLATGSLGIRKPTESIGPDAVRGLVSNIRLLAGEVGSGSRTVISLGDNFPGSDTASAEMEHLFRMWSSLSDRNLVLMLTVDSDRCSVEWPSEGAPARLLEVQMKPLAPGEVDSLICGFLGSAGVPAKAVELVKSVCQGNAGLAGIILARLLANGNLVRGIGKWVYIDKKLPALPKGLKSAYSGLISSLEPRDRKLLGLLAWLNLPGDREILTDITGFTGHQVGIAMLGLMKHGLLRKMPGTGRIDYQIPRWLLPIGKRAVTKKQVLGYATRAIEVLTSRGSGDHAALALLYGLVGDTGSAIASSLDAARSAIESGDPIEGATHAERALAHLKKAPLPPERKVDTLLEVGDILAGAKRFTGALACYRRALRSTSGNRKDSILRSIGYVHERTGNHEKARQYYLRALRHARQSGHAETASGIENDLAWISMRLGKHKVARQHAMRVIEELRGTDRYGELSQAYSTLGVSAWTTSRWEDALGFHRRCLELRRKGGDRPGEARTLNNIGLVLRSMGRWDEAVKSFERSVAIKNDINDRAGLAGTHLNLGFIHFERGDLDRALAESEDAMAEANMVGDNLIYVEASGLAGEIKHTMGDLAGALEILRRTVRLAEEVGAANEVCVAGRRYAEVLFDEGDTDQARTLVKRAYDKAVELGSELEQGCALRSLGRIEGSRDGSKGMEFLRQSEKKLKALNSQFELGRTYLAQAELGTTIDRDAALNAANLAAELFTRMSARHELGKVEEVLGKLGSGPAIPHTDKRLDTLFRIAKTVNSYLEQDDLLEVILDLAIETTGAERGFILLSRNGSLEIVTARNIEREKMETARDLSRSVVREVLKTGKPIMSVDALADPRLKSNKSVVAFNIRSLVAVPLRIKDDIVGAIYEDTRTSVGYFNRDHVDFLMAFADQAAVAMENARLYGELKTAKRLVEMENRALRNGIQETGPIPGMVGISKPMREVFEQIQVAGDSDENVLLLGESGTGKEVAARAVHFMSPRRDRPFVAVNCASIPKDLMESELFGHEKGAFTGAHKTRLGYFESADGGTLLLDEIAEMDRPMQAKLLRLIETKEFTRLGSVTPRRCDVRIIATTNREMDEEVREGRFRSDLYFRLKVICMEMPPLRSRKEDIPLLVEHMLSLIARENRQAPRSISPSTLEALMRHSWPGNVRELENCMRSAWASSRGGVITRQHLPLEVGSVGGRGRAGTQMQKLIGRLIDEGEYSEDDPLLPKVERALVRRMVEKIGEKKKSAELLGISKPTLYTKLRGQ